MFLVGKLPTALQHMQHLLMYNPEHTCTRMLLLWVEDVECRKEARIMASKVQCFVEAARLVMEKFSSEPRFEPRTPQTECSIPFNVQLGP